MNKFTINTGRGFSLVEMLVAVSLLLFVIAGPMAVTSRVARSASFASEQAQATALAQEGADMVKRYRDNLFLGYFKNTNPADPWTEFTDTSGSGDLRRCYNATNGCGIYWIDSNNLIDRPINCTGSGSACLLYRKNDAGAVRPRYTHDPDNATETEYTRVIRLAIEGREKVKVTSTVTWRTGSLVDSQKVETVTYLYNIYALP